MNNTTATQAVTNALSAGNTEIGFLIWWSLRDCSMKRVDLEAWVTVHGLNAAIPDDWGALSLLGRAEGRVQSGCNKRVIFRQLQKSTGSALHAILEQLTDSAGDRTRYEQINTVKLDRAGKTVSFESASETYAMRLANEFGDLLLNADTQDISSMVAHSMRHLDAVPMRDSGGVYFVDNRRGETLMALADLVNGMGGSTFNVFRVRDASERQQIANEAQRNITGRVVELRQELAAFSGETALLPETENVHQRSVNVRAERLKKLEADVDFYAYLLGDLATELKAQIASTREQFETAVGIR